MNKRERARENLIKSGQPIVKREAVQCVSIQSRAHHHAEEACAGSSCL